MAWTVHLVAYVFIMSSIAYRSGDGLNPPFYYQYERTHSAAQFFNGRSIPRNRDQRIQPQQQRRTDSAVEELQAENGSFKILNTFHKRGAAESASGAIVFPGPTAGTKAPLVDETPECRKIGLCTEVPNFPSEEINNLIDKLLEEGKTIFHVDKLDIPEFPEIAQRLGPVEQNIELCESDEKITYPKELMDENKKIHIVLNTDEKPVQGVRTEVCRSESPCKSYIDVPRAYTSGCRQKYQLREFYTYDKEKNVTKVEYLRVPSCCACVLNMTYHEENKKL